METEHSSTEKRLFELIGGYGPWQKTVCMIFFYCAAMNVLYNHYILLVTLNEEYRCASPTSESKINSFETINNTTTVLRANGKKSLSEECWIDIVSENETGLSNATVPCTKWEYSTDYYNKSIVSEWDLVCDRKWLISVSKSAYLLGYMFVIVSGNISDRVGRFPTIMGGAIIALISSITASLSTSYTMFIVCRMLISAGRGAVTSCGFVLMAEIVDSSHRNQLPMMMHLGYACGHLLFPGVGWLVRRWTWLILALEALNLPSLCLLWISPESPRWLLVQRKNKKFVETLEKAAKWNKRAISHQDIEHLLAKGKVENAKKNIVDLLKMPKERKKLAILAFIWITITLLFYSVAYSLGDLSGNPYLNFTIIGVVEVVSKIVLLFFIHRISRKKLLLSVMISSGGMLVITSFVPSHHFWLTTVLVMVSRCILAFLFPVLYLLTAELFATVVRGSGFSTCSMLARIGSVMAPFTKELGSATHAVVPRALVGSLSLLVGLTVLMLPETKDKELADTIEDPKTTSGKSRCPTTSPRETAA